MCKCNHIVSCKYEILLIDFPPFFLSQRQMTDRVFMDITRTHTGRHSWTAKEDNAGARKTTRSCVTPRNVRICSSTRTYNYMQCISLRIYEGPFLN